MTKLKNIFTLSSQRKNLNNTSLIPSPIRRGLGGGIKNTKAFTLVELIIVITILAVLATIAFISFQGFAKNARDGNRLATLKQLQNGLEVFATKTGYYPDPENDANGKVLTGYIVVPSAGTQIISNKGVFGDNSARVIQASKTPKDPLASSEYYVYAITSDKKQYQIATILETLNANKNNLIQKTYAGNEGNYKSYVVGNYKGYIKLGQYLANVPSLIWNNTGTVDLLSGSTFFVANKSLNLPYKPNSDTNISISNGNDIVKFITGNSGAVLTGVTVPTTVVDTTTLTTWLSTLSNSGVIINSFSNGNDLQSGINSLNYVINGTNTTPQAQVVSQPASSVSQTICESAGWARVSGTGDVYIGSTRGNGFCISPTVNFVNQDSNYGGISWNGRGYYNGNASYNGWNSDSYTPNIRDSDVNDSTYAGQTRNLINVVNSSTTYSCTPLGSATSGLTLSDSNNSNLTDNPNSNSASQDTLENRMRYLAKYKNSTGDISSINWISSNAKPSGHYVYPALYLADCIDGVRDLGTDMVYKHSNDTTSTIAYSGAYDKIESTTTSASLSNATYQNRQKYLLGWTQKPGSHLPSAYSYISDGTPGGCSSSSCNNITGNGKGEYQVACEASPTTPSFAGTNDNGSKRVWLASIGYYEGSSWGSSARIVGSSGCSSQTNGNAGYRGSSMAARFVVR